MLATLAKRLKYQGGNQQGRMQRDKLQSLRKALLYSYQAATAVVDAKVDGKDVKEQFRCLINPDKTKGDYDNKILSIPYEDIQLNEIELLDRGFDTTTNGRVPTKLKPGNVFVWKETKTHWLIYLEYLEQDAYFRADIRRCDQQAKIDDELYWVYIRGPVETSIPWNQKKQVEWNDMNYSLVMYITKDQHTTAAIHRFTNIKVFEENSQINKTWQVVAVNPYFGDGIIQVFLDEWFENQSQEARQEELRQQLQSEPIIDETKPYIEGPLKVRCYGSYEYKIHNVSEIGNWYVIYNNKEIDLHRTGTQIKFNVNIGKSGACTLVYKIESKSYYLDITIESI